ncbi:hypothetical protein A3962_14655 [Meiothermus taiwanensis]|nr:hypothetical protein A3962_14655 [Meiothermus taiwanensis]
MLVLSMLLFTSGFAQDMPSPGGGPDFGKHVSGMAPEHPREHGAQFGACVSSMARGEGCVH